jgi:hypothetical protein
LSFLKLKFICFKFRNELDEISSRLDEMYRTQNTHFKDTLDLKQLKLRKQQESYTTTTFNETSRPKSPDNSINSFNIAAKTTSIQNKSIVSEVETEKSLASKHLKELKFEHEEDNQPQKEQNKSLQQQTLNDSYEDDFDNNSASNSSN